MLGKYPLNPHASSFIPGKKSETIKEKAVKYVTELWERKKANGEKTVSNQEVAKLVGHFISIGFKELTDSNKIKIQNYLNEKLLSSKASTVRPVSVLAKSRSKLGMKFPKRESFDISKCQTPVMSFLLVAFWGLYRHEQAQRPLLSLTYRPDVVRDRIWSVDASDKKLWNQSCVSKVCECPPMFGYSVPSNFFGNPTHLHYTCPIQSIHLNHYSESKEGNEFILTNNLQQDFVDEQPPEDVKVNVTAGASIDILKDQFETTVSGICSLLAKLAEGPCSETENNKMDGENNYYTSLWDDIDSKISHVPIFKQDKDSLVDDNDHPLLELSDAYKEEEVSLEVKEMIRKSLSIKKDELLIQNTFGSDKEKYACDPPCSVWCDTVTKENDSEEINMDSVTARDHENFEYAPLIDLISLEQLDSKEKIKPVNITLKPASNFCSDKMKSGQRSLSVGDCEPYYYEKKSDFMGVTAHVSNFATTKSISAFLKKDPFNFLNSCYRSDSWEDADSGFVSRSSSEDDVFGGRCEKDSMWNQVSGEDSLWKPLPECVETIEKSFPHRRVHDFRRKLSLS